VTLEVGLEDAARGRRPAVRAPRRARLGAVLLGHPSARRIVLTHAIDDIADSLVNLSLVGSLFFSVSLEASRGRILLFLALTAAPLAVVAPVVGPLLDRVRSGYRTIMVGSQLARAALALALAGSLLSLGFYPIVFGILLSRKAYALSKTAVVAQVAEDRTILVSTSAHLARTGTITGGVGTAIGGILLATGEPEWLLLVASATYVVAAAAGLRIPSAAPVVRLAGAVLRAETPPQVRAASWAVSAIRTATGALTFLLAFAIKRGGGEQWIFAAGLVAGGVGAFTGTVVAPWLHRRLTEDRVVVLTLLVPGVVSAMGVLTIGSASIIVIAFAIGIGGSVASRSMDAMYGRVPTVARGRVIARSELRFQLANLTGGALAVLAAPGPRPGFAVVALALLVAGITYASSLRLSLRHEAGRLLLGDRRPELHLELPRALLGEAMRLCELQAYQMAVVVADGAVRVLEERTQLPPSTPTLLQWRTLGPTISSVLLDDEQPDADVAVGVISAARALIDEAELLAPDVPTTGLPATGSG